MDEAIKEPEWLTKLDKRLRPHVRFARDYVAKHNHGTPGHINLVAIAALSDQLDAAHAELLEMQRKHDAMLQDLADAINKPTGIPPWRHQL